MKPTNFPDNMKSKRQKALANLEKRSKLTDVELVSTGKCFRNKPIPTKEVISGYRALIESQIQTLQRRLG